MVHKAEKYIVDIGWKLLLKELGVRPEDMLRHAQLPLDFFSRKTPTLDTQEYFRLWNAAAHLMGDDELFPMRIAQAFTPEVFNPPIFASFCSPDLNTALTRLAQYRPLVCPMHLVVAKMDSHTQVTIEGPPHNDAPPASMIAMDLVWFVHLARMATRERIEPAAVYSSVPIPGVRAYEDYFGARVQRGNVNAVCFHAEDAAKPFLSANESMWQVFDAELQTRLADLEVGAGYGERVRACLMEIMAGGKCSIDDVAGALAITPRTLQRRLKDEGTTFQKILNALREDLARHYLTNTRYSSAEISFLLGYDDPNSFFRAFHAWTGQTPEAVRDVRH